MASVPFAIATIPVAVYFILIGALRLRTRPLITTGWRDLLTLAIAASGFVAIGPMQLFFPSKAAALWQGWVWIALFALYFLLVIMILLSTKPRLIAYGLDENQFRESLLSAAKSLDENSSWNAGVLSIPTSGMQLAIEPSGTARVQQVVHVGLLHNLTDWVKLERAFAKLGSQTTCPRSPAGWPFVIGGGFLLACAFTPMISDPGNALAQLQDFLNH